MTKKMLSSCFKYMTVESLETSSLHTTFCVSFVALGKKDGILVFKKYVHPSGFVAQLLPVSTEIILVHKIPTV